VVAFLNAEQIKKAGDFLPNGLAKSFLKFVALNSHGPYFPPL